MSDCCLVNVGLKYILEMNLHKLLRSFLPRELNIPRNIPQKLLRSLGYFRFRTRIAAEGAKVPDLDLYQPLYSPWEGDAAFMQHYKTVQKHTLVSPDRCWMLLSLMRHALHIAGDFAEMGVFKGGTALLAARVLSEAHDRRPLHLFDSFEGMPVTSAGEPYVRGDFGQTSAERVRELVSHAGANVQMRIGFIPQTFQGLEISRLAFAHVDVDLFQSVLDCVAYVYPRLSPGGILVFDDYGFPGCVRAREAVDLAFATLPEKPIYLPTGQAVVIKLASVG